MRGVTRQTKNASAVLDYTINWAGWLGTDQIASAEWYYPAGITAVNATATTAATTVWLSGGTPGLVYRVSNRIWTSGGRVDVRHLDVGID